MPQVPTVRTPMTPERAKALIERAWEARVRSKPSTPPMTPEGVALLLALWDLETATGAQHRNFNFGNQVATLPEQEFYKANDSGNLRKFRSYDTAEEGAASFVAQLTSDTRPQWRNGLASGDPVEFVRGLKGLNSDEAKFEYFEAPFERYLDTFLGRWERYDPKARPPQRGTLPTRPSQGRHGLFWIGLSLGLTVLGVFRYSKKVRGTGR